jgi:ribonucleoside-diphosphate reductase alpha chain
LDKIRAAGSWIKKTKGASSGVVPLVKVLNDTAIYINQEGKRAGAVSPSLSVWHLDVLEFLEIQLEEGDQRTKSFDVMPQLVYYDEFMSRVENDQMWTLFDPYEARKALDKDLADLFGEDFTAAYEDLELMAEHGELELFKKVRARDIMKAHYKALRVAGMPYVTFKDTINNHNPNKDSGTIYGANICVESFSNFEADTTAHVCNLISVNAARCIKETEEATLDKVYTLSSLATLMLDATIDIGNPSVAEAGKHNSLYRTIGVGVLGMADYMAYYGKSFETKEGSALASEFMEVLAMAAVSTSTIMAEVAGPYPKFRESEWAKGNMLGQNWEDFVGKCKYPEEWAEIRQKVMEVGIRNGQLIAIAPNSSTGILHGVSPSILPAWKLMFVENTQLGNLIRLPYFVKDRALWYKAYPDTDMEKMIEFISSVQTFVDSGISFELVLNLNEKSKSGMKYWYSLVDKAWKSNLKTLYYTRFITSNSDEFEQKCIGCAN